MKRPFWIVLTLVMMAIAAIFGNGIATRSAQAAPAAAPLKQPAGQGSWQRVWRMEGYLYDFQAFDASTIMGVGSDGMIVISTDGGVYWHYTAPVDNVDLRGLSASANAIWAAGDNGTILKSQDMGKSWEILDAGVTSNIHDIFSLGGNNSWIVGEGGLMMRTQDGGATWTALTSGVSVDLNNIKFFDDAMHGIAVGDAGTLLLTSDGGQSWQQQTGVVPTADNLKDSHLFGSKAWVVGDNGVVYFSEDMGATWIVQAAPRFPMTRIEMAPGQDQIGWLTGLNGRIAKTTNGGQSWRANSGDDGYDLYALGLGDTEHIWVGGAVMTESMGNWGKPPNKPSWFVWHSADGGSKWKALITGLYPWFYNVTAASDKDAYVTGQDLQMMKTKDAGYSWREIHSEFISNPDIVPAGADVRGKILHAVACAPDDPNDCHAVGREEMLLHTRDGGDTWTREYVPGWGKSLYDIAMTTAESGITISRNYNYFTDDGVHWQGAFDNDTVGRTHLDLDMINSWQGIASSKKNTFNYTLDAGRHWKQYYISSYYFYNSGADALDFNQDGELDYAWLVGCTVQSSVEGPCLKALILFNPDAVNDHDGWRPLLLDENVPRLQKIEMVDEQAGWVVGFEGAILFTEDGGVTWTRQDANTTSNLYGLDVYDRNLAYAVGLSGDIVRYSEPDRRLNANPQWITQIDGDLDEWSAMNARHVNSADIDTLVGETPDPQALDANVRIRWDDLGLYLGIDVHDVTLTTTGSTIDKVGIALDGLADGVVGDDDHTLQFYADGSAQWDAAPMASQRYGIQTTADGYTIEAFIPQEALGGNFQHLRKFGINVALYDAQPDTASYVSQLFWTGDSLDADPSTFGTLTLFQFDRNQPTQKSLATGDITIDGNLDDWTDEESYRLTIGSADSVQGSFPESDADLSATWRMRWWQDHLFLGVQVTDDVVTAGDSVQIAFDVDGNSQPSAPDMTLRLWPDGTVAINGELAGGILSQGQHTDSGYQIETAIPAALLGGDFISQQKLHINYGLLDFDDTGDAFDTAMTWQGASVSGVQADFGWLELTPLSLLIKVDKNDPRIRDTFISEWLPTSNYFNAETMNIRTGGIETPLVWFDINNAVPENAEVSRSYLGLYTTDSRYAMTARIYRLLRPWVEYETTWQLASTGTPWQAPGARGEQDQATEPTDEQTLALASDDGSCGDRNATWFDITTDVNDIAHHRITNYGWTLRGDAGSNINYALGASQHRNPDCRPEIYFEYTLPPGELPAPTPMPTPTPQMQRLYLPIITP